MHYQDSEFKRRVVERCGSLAVLCNDDKLESLASYRFLTRSWDQKRQLLDDMLAALADAYHLVTTAEYVERLATDTP